MKKQQFFYISLWFVHILSMGLYYGVLSEKVQHRATKIGTLKGLCYEERLKVLELPSLENRRTRGDLIQMFKIAKGYDKIDFHHPPTYTETRSRGHNMKIRRELIKNTSKCGTIRHNFFINRVTNDWNGLPEDVINSTSINVFKNKIDKIFKF